MCLSLLLSAIDSPFLFICVSMFPDIEYCSVFMIIGIFKIFFQSTNKQLARKNVCCTDIAFLILFIAFWGGMVRYTQNFYDTL